MTRKLAPTSLCLATGLFSLTLLTGSAVADLGDDCCEFGRPRVLTIQYTGEDCSASSNTQDNDECSGDPALAPVVHVIANNKSNPNDGDIWFDGNVNLGESFDADAAIVGETRLDNDTYVHVFDTNDVLLQTVKFKTNCSQPLFVGNQFGSAFIAECLGEFDPDGDDDNDCCDLGDPRLLTLRYTGENCSASANSQSSGSVDCTGDPALAPVVHIIANDKSNPDDGDIWFDGTVSLNQTFDLDAATQGETTLDDKTFVHIFDTSDNLLQLIEFKTDCSQPLFLGDQFGGVVIAGCLGELEPDPDCGPNDCNSNGIGDDCELSNNDCNGNGIPDECDTDCNSSGLPDECEDLADCNSDGTPDVCESDCDSDNVPDNCETDCNSNGTPDDCEALADCNGDGTPNVCEPDCDGDTLPDDCETDCNSNGMPDDCEAFTDCNSNGLIDECEPDCNANGVADECDISAGTQADCNLNSIPDSCDIASGMSTDADMNGIPDECGDDCNMNGVSDTDDIALGTSTDLNFNGIPDECDVPSSAFCFCPMGPCGNNDPLRGCMTSLGQGTAIVAGGTSSVLADDLFIRMTPLPNNTFGLFFNGPVPLLGLPFGDGIRCAGGSLNRFSIQNSGMTGSIVFGPVVSYANANFNLAGQIVGGSTWHFQGWFRDALGPCGSSFNLTHGLSITFTP